MINQSFPEIGRLRIIASPPEKEWSTPSLEPLDSFLDHGIRFIGIQTGLEYTLENGTGWLCVITTQPGSFLDLTVKHVRHAAKHGKHIFINGASELCLACVLKDFICRHPIPLHLTAC